MPASKSNESGSANPADVPYGSWESFPWEPFPDYGGTKSIIYRSTDGKIVAGLRSLARERSSGLVDEALFVTEGWIKFRIGDGEAFTQKKGDFCYLRKGHVVHMEISDDCGNVAAFINTEPVTLV
ncbi:hypothetical protein B0T10DRAFT_416557 [Thelonectria olida]|uniref:(S)-ureidoglycine aminohydrolase cupin domain-containing protein n=1 Tax=Thelonectria olida TaxID=1576542 RepID=A0A9P8VSG1_9HYPO|nr:hypothetical protein B0T10DRAFT_416557 [Thelonectria olida]